MKILHLNTSMQCGGAERLIETLAVLMNNKGHEVEVMIGTDYNNIFVSQLHKNKIPVKAFYNKPKSYYNPFIIFKLIKYFKKFDIIHAHLYPLQLWIIVASVLSFKKTVLITTEHNTENGRRGKFLFKLLDKWMYKKFHKIISISKQTQENLINWTDSEKDAKHIIINNGIDVDFFKNATAVNRNELGAGNLDGKTLVLMSARFVEQKDHETVLKAIAELGENVCLLLAGDGPLKDKYVKMSIDLGISKRVHFLGLRTDIERIVKTSDICVLSSHWEGFGLAALEYMAAGKATIVSDVGGLKQTVGDGALTFTPSNHKDLAEKISLLMNNERKVIDLQRAAQLHSGKFSIEHMATSYINLYNSELASQKFK